jgi:hypothetical protein
MDQAFGRSKTLTRRYFASLAGAGGAALDGSGVIYPEATFASIAAMTRNPCDIENYSVQWARPGQHTLWSEDTYVTAGLPRVLTFHTDAQQVCLALPDGSRLSGPARGGDPTQFGLGLDAVSTWTAQWAADSTSVQVIYGSPVPAGQDVNVIVFRAVDTGGNMIGGPAQFAVPGRRPWWPLTLSAAYADCVSW